METQKALLARVPKSANKWADLLGITGRQYKNIRSGMYVLKTKHIDAIEKELREELALLEQLKAERNLVQESN